MRLSLLTGIAFTLCGGLVPPIVIAETSNDVNPPTTLFIKDGTIRDVSFPLTVQTKYRFGIPKRVQSLSGFNLEFTNTPLSDVLRFLEHKYNLCSWIWINPNPASIPDLNEIRWARCDDRKPQDFTHFEPHAWKFISMTECDRKSCK